MAGEWEDVALQDVADELTVGFVGSMASEYVEDGVPFLRSLNVEPLRINKDDLKYISRDFHERITKSRLTPGDVVIVRTGKPGACAVIPEWLSDANCSDLVIVRCGERINNRFLAYYVNTAASGHVSAHLVGAVQQHFNVGSARTLRIRLPPLPEQKRIAHILGTLDDKIELNRRMNATLEGISRAIFKSWFVDFDPVRQKAAGQQPVGMDAQTAAMFPDSFEDSEIGRVPTGWQRSSLDSLFPSEECVITGPFGSTLHASDYRDSGTPLILVKHVVDGRFVDMETMPLVGAHKAIELSRYLVEAGDIVFTRVGAVGRSAYVSASDAGRLISGQMLRVRIPWVDVIDPRFLAQVFIEPSFIAMVEGHALGTTRPSLNTGLLKSFRFVMPSARLTTVFAQTVSPKDALRQQLTVQSTTLAALRDTLLPKLLSGEIRVPEAEEAVEEVLE